MSKPRSRKNSDKTRTTLSDHTRRGKLLLPPFAELEHKTSGKMSPTSWLDGGLNDILWAALLITSLDRDDCLRIFRTLIANARQTLSMERMFITHSAFSCQNEDEFDILMEPVLSHSRAKQALRTLMLIDCLPDKSHWSRYLWEISQNERQEYCNRLAITIINCLDHQSQASTDLRWLKVAYFAVAGRLIFAKDMRPDLSEELRLYPNYGDQRSVRPTIRSLEIGLRGMAPDGKTRMELPPELQDRAPDDWSKSFWHELLGKSTCIYPLYIEEDNCVNDDLLHELGKLYASVLQHFFDTLTDTNIDSKHNVAFCLPLYSICLLMGAARARVHQRLEGRIILRVIVEVFITLHFLSAKDKHVLWTQFRNYGNGQAKLAFLKNIDIEDRPEYVKLADLERYANEDFWEEFLSINLKSWSDKNIRSIADEAGVKDVYDKYFDWSSGYIHAHWGAVRETTLVVCLNPLHRLHKIPAPPRYSMPSVIGDAIKLTNRILDDLNHLYPDFNYRIKWSPGGRD